MPEKFIAYADLVASMSNREDYFGPYMPIEPVEEPRMTYMDTEFIPEVFGTSGLISIGIVDNKGHEYYVVNREMHWDMVRDHPWLGKYVWPYLPRTADNELDFEHPDVKGLEEIKKDLVQFFGMRQCELTTWYGSSDMFRMHSLWGGDWTHMPEDIPQWSHELQSLVLKRGNPQLPSRDDTEHHALDDAKYTRLVEEFLYQNKCPRLFDYPVC